VKSVRSLIVAGSLLLTAVAVVPAQQPTPTPVPGARPRKMARAHRGKQFDKALLRGVTLSDAEKTNLQAVRAKYAAQRQTLRTQLRTNAQGARDARQRGDTAALRSIRANVVSQRQSLAQAERNDVRNVLTPANQAKFDANLKRVEARTARKPFRANRLSNR
jgi:Spy/CpxP family protein refolding chaperone